MDWLNQNQLHGLLADDMGLGKTLQAIASMRSAYEHANNGQPSLILAPKSVMIHWQRELQRSYPGIRVQIYHGQHRRSTMYQRHDPMIFVTTYDTAANDIELLKKIPFFFLILDEATNIKNPETKRAQAVKSTMPSIEWRSVAHRSRIVPQSCGQSSILLMRGHLGQYGTFKRIYEDG